MSQQSERKVRRFRRPDRMGSPGRRFCVNWPAEIRGDGARLDGALVDISCGGGKLLVADFPRNLAQFWLAVENAAPIRAEIAWRKTYLVGLRFMEEQAWVSELHKQRFDPAAWLETP